MARVKIMKNGKQVASSKNLEVILRYQREYAPISDVTQVDNILYVDYEDGATCKTRFEDPSVLRDWIEKKRRRGVFPQGFIPRGY